MAPTPFLASTVAARPREEKGGAAVGELLAEDSKPRGIKDKVMSRGTDPQAVWKWEGASRLGVKFRDSAWIQKGAQG